MPRLSDLKVKLFTDGADKAQIVEMAKQQHIAGFTTNPSLLKKAGVKDYESYARELVAAVPDKHISFEVISDDIEQMIAEARLITKWGKNVYVKLPIINTKGELLTDAIKMLSGEGVKINVTVVTTIEQAKKATLALSRGPGGIVSVFAGRLADLGIDYVPLVETTVKEARATKQVEVIWASTREVWNVIEADRMGCHIITAPADILKKLTALGTKTAEDLALDGVKAFRADTLAAGLTLKTNSVRRTAAE
ncbi:MAG TPA: transaldolase family protein [Xanthobacteraceae bacterium]|nr:transaldolase family protein [Xanthobacteraceae bacterium]